MLSICVPVYNFDVRPLVKELSRQMELLTVPSELILIDDASTLLIEENKEIRNNHQWIQLSQNIGRARIRNLFLEYVQFEYLLFLDCDSLVVTDDFLERYINAAISQQCDVICGGRFYRENQPAKECRLKWFYAKHRESQSADIRRKKPYHFFKTGCFLIKKAVLESIKFDERIVGYGHEDTLFAFRLMQNEYSVIHIDNPVFDRDEEINSVFLQKTETSIGNLILILSIVQDTEFNRFVNLSRVGGKLENKIAKFILRVSHSIIYYLLNQYLFNAKISLVLFDGFKLYCYLRTRSLINGKSK